MTYDDFSAKLDQMMADFRKAHGREMGTVAELKSYLDRRLVKPKKKGAKSLRGVFG